MVAEAVFSTDSVRKVTRIENLAEVIASANSPMGRARYATMVRSQGVPLYRSDPAGGGVFIETLPGGIERRGRFVNRRFIPF